MQPATLEKKLKKINSSAYVLIPVSWLKKHNRPTHLILTMKENSITLKPLRRRTTKDERLLSHPASAASPATQSQEATL